MSVAGQLFTALEFVGTVSFSVSGAMVAIKKRVDLFGVLFLGIITALGGGMLRDMMLGIVPPAMFRNPFSLIVAVITALLVFLLAMVFRRQYISEEMKIDHINNVFDALGLGAFTITGVQAAINAGFAENLILLVFMGMVTGIGGGLIRDLMVMEIPFVLRKRVYAVASILGGSLFCLLRFFKISDSISIFISVITVFSIRLLATKFKWNLPKAIKE